jgi:LysM repeat protein
MIFEHGAPDSRFGFFVSAPQLASLPRTQPHPTLRVAQSQDGFAVLYWLDSNEYQINAGPDFEGKTFVFRFAIFPNQTPIVETFFGGVRIPLASTSPTTPTTSSGDVIRYVVQPGDNLFRIGLRFGVPYQQLAAFNNISDPTRIFVGQVIFIPQ